MLATSRALKRVESRLQQIEADTKALETAPSQPFDDEPLWDALEALQQRLQELTLAVDEGIQRVDRSERRVRAVVARAQAEFEEHGHRSPGLEAEAAQLRFLDGEGSGGGGVQPVHEAVEGDPPGFDARAFPGQWSADDVAHMMRAVARGH